MKYLRVNWYCGNNEGYFVQPGESFESCRQYAYEVADYEDVNVKSFQFANEDDYEKYLQKH